jgi:tRNA-2-methylthio-N6-dimethylallyladenosine synthase
LEKLTGVEGLLRIRFTTSHPKDLSRELMETIAANEKIARQIHLPVQSGSDNVLRRMRRGYTRGEYLEKVDALRRMMPDIAITTDLIVGFPGESEEDFADTMSLVETADFLSGFSFMYSDRPNTRAAGFEEKVPDEVKSRRLALLQELLKTHNNAHQQRLVGESVEVLVTGESRVGKGQMSGRSEDFRVVNFPGEDHLAGRLVEVVVEEALPNCLRGKIKRSAEPLEISSI